MAVPATLETVAVIGSGPIGYGMAQVFAAAGREVVMIGRREEILAAAMNRIGRSLATLHATMRSLADVLAALTIETRPRPDGGGPTAGVDPCRAGDAGGPERGEGAPGLKSGAVHRRELRSRQSGRT